jgi:predicted nucleic acid-binding protein
MKKVLVDSDFWFGLVVSGDSHHEACKKIFRDVVNEKISIYSLRLVVYETATILSYKIDQKRSLMFLGKFRALPVILIDVDADMERRAWDIFGKQTKKGTSFVDCANVAAAEKYHFDRILSFDRFYQTK